MEIEWDISRLYYTAMTSAFIYSFVERTCSVQSLNTAACAYRTHVSLTWKIKYGNLRASCVRIVIVCTCGSPAKFSSLCYIWFTCMLHLAHLHAVFGSLACCIWLICMQHLAHLHVTFGSLACRIRLTCMLHLAHLHAAFGSLACCIWHTCMRHLAHLHAPFANVHDKKSISWNWSIYLSLDFQMQPHPSAPSTMPTTATQKITTIPPAIIITTNALGVASTAANAGLYLTSANNPGVNGPSTIFDSGAAAVPSTVDSSQGGSTPPCNPTTGIASNLYFFYWITHSIYLHTIPHFRNHRALTTHDIVWMSWWTLREFSCIFRKQMGDMKVVASRCPPPFHYFAVE